MPLFPLPYLNPKLIPNPLLTPSKAGRERFARLDQRVRASFRNFKWESSYFVLEAPLPTVPGEQRLFMAAVLLSRLSGRLQERERQRLWLAGSPRRPVQRGLERAQRHFTISQFAQQFEEISDELARAPSEPVLSRHVRPRQLASTG
jgi:hypothetical protein